MKRREEGPLVVVDHVYQKIDGRMHLVPVYEIPEPDELMGEEEQEQLQPTYEPEDDQEETLRRVVYAGALLAVAIGWLCAAPPMLDWTTIKVDTMTQSMERLGSALLDLLGLALLYLVPSALVLLLVAQRTKRGRKQRTEEKRPEEPVRPRTEARSITINNITINRTRDEK